jgi:hypothetical protein
MLQPALLSLNYALYGYLFTVDKVIAGAVSFTALGLLFYLLIISTATLPHN